MPLAYLILATPNSSHEAIARDLRESGFTDDETVALVSLSNGPTSTEDIPAAEPLPEADHYLFLAHPWEKPPESVDAFAKLTERGGLEVARLLFVANCQLLHENPELAPWYEAAIHFSDYILLNNRQAVPNKWISDFIASYEQQCYPCTFEQVKKDSVRNPALALDPTPRRLSHLFDDIDAIDAMEWDEENLPEEPVDLVRPPDKYLKRRADGSREVRLPNMRDYATPET